MQAVVKNTQALKMSVDENDTVVWMPEVKPVIPKILTSGQHITNKRVIIPEGVQEIGENAFINNDYIEEVVLPSTIKMIGYQAFAGCTNLKRIFLPEGLHTILPAAFYGCVSLEEVELPSTLKILSSEMFFGCESLKKVVIPQTVKKTGYGVFKECTSLEEVDFPPEMKISEYDIEMFCGCTSLKRVKLPKGIDILPDAFFAYCTSLPNPILPQKLRKIGNAVFRGCAFTKISIAKQYRYGKDVFADCVDLVEATFLNPAGNILPAGIFDGCTKLSKVTLDDKITLIEETAFRNCTSLKNIRLPNSLLSIYRNAFMGSGLEEIYLPANLFEIDHAVFDAPNLAKIIVDEANKTFSCLDGVGLYKDNRTVFVKFAPACDLESYEIEEGVAVFDSSTFHCANKLKELSIPSSVSFIPPNSFDGADNLKTLIVNKEDGYSALAIRGMENSLLHKFYDEDDDEVKEDNERDNPFESVQLTGNYTSIELNTFCYFNHLKDFTLPREGKYEIKRGEDILKIPRLFIPKNAKMVDGNRNSDSKTFADSTILEFEEGPTIEAKDFYLKTTFLKEKFPNATDNAPEEISAYFTSDDKYYIKEAGKPLTLVDMKGLNCKDRNFLYVYWVYRLQEAGIKWKSFYDGRIANYFYDVYDSDIDRFIRNFDGNVKRVFAPILKNDLGGDLQQAAIHDLIKISRVMGVFEDNEIVRQRACRFMEERLFPELKAMQKDSELGAIIHMVFDAVDSDEVRKYNARRAKFVADNYKALCKKDSDGSAFFARCINSFRSIQDVTRKNRGYQDLKEVTIEKCERFFLETSFKYVTAKNMELAKFLSTWYIEDLALQHAEVLVKDSKKAPRNIFTKYKAIVKKKTKVVTLHFDNNPENDLKDSAVHKYMFKWLPKQDLNNLVLGKMVRCCASVICAGEGIVASTMISDNCQNMVIRDSFGKIVAKGALQVNRAKGYAVFNMPNVGDSVPQSDYAEILEVFKRGALAFCEEYNKNNPTCPIKQVNIGRHGTLASVLNLPETEPLEVTNYGEFVKERYGEGWKTYGGDAQYQSPLLSEKEILK